MFSCDCISMTCCTHGLEALVIYTVSWLVRYRLSKLDHPINQWRPFELNEIPTPQGQVPIMVDLFAALRSDCLPVFGVLCFAAFWNFWPAPSSKNVLWKFFLEGFLNCLPIFLGRFPEFLLHWSLSFCISLVQCWFRNRVLEGSSNCGITTNVTTVV